MYWIEDTLMTYFRAQTYIRELTVVQYAYMLKHAWCDYMITLEKKSTCPYTFMAGHLQPLLAQFISNPH